MNEESAKRNPRTIKEVGSHTLQIMWALRRVVVHAVEPFGLTLTQAITLTHISNGTDTPTALAQALSLPRPNVSNLLLALEDLSLVERRAHRQDGRKIQIVLTPEGAEQVARLHEALWESDQLRLNSASENELRQMASFFQRLVS